MKRSSLSSSVLSCLATAACLALPLGPAAAAEPYKRETHGPRIGSRIIYFFKDLAFGENPNDRYRHLPKNQPPAVPRQHSYGAPQGQRFNLDQPPPINGGIPPQRPPQSMPPQEQMDPRNAPPSDMPYSTPPVNRDRQTDFAGQEEDIPPVKVKPKPTPAPKPMVDDQPPKPVQKTIPQESAAPETQTASTKTESSKKSWQSFAGDAPANPTTTAPTPPNPKSASTPVSPNSTTLTGSKTTKEGRVKSPYAPYNELDVTGLPAGSLAMDPTTGKVFRVP